jgi:hypothetical protein
LYGVYGSRDLDQSLESVGCCRPQSRGTSTLRYKLNTEVSARERSAASDSELTCNGEHRPLTGCSHHDVVLGVQKMSDCVAFLDVSCRKFEDRHNEADGLVSGCQTEKRPACETLVCFVHEFGSQMRSLMSNKNALGSSACSR